MKINRNRDGLFHLRFRSQYLLNSTLLRFQEYDSEEFGGTLFTVEEFMDWYAKKNGKFDYFDTTLAMGFHGESMWPFYAGFFDPLTKKEEKILDLFLGKDLDNIFIIGTFRDREIRHETAHGLYNLNPEYREEVNRILKTISKRNMRKLEKMLGEEDYNRGIWKTEVNAYLIERRLYKKVPNCPQRKLLMDLFDEYTMSIGQTILV